MWGYILICGRNIAGEKVASDIEDYIFHFAILQMYCKDLEILSMCAQLRDTQLNWNLIQPARNLVKS